MHDKEAEDGEAGKAAEDKTREAQAREAEANEAAAKDAKAREEKAREEKAKEDKAKQARESDRAYDDAVKAILTTFGVFTGFAIKSAIDAIFLQPSSAPPPPPSPSWWAILDLLKDSHLYIAIATIALLLRFIIGSAVHLNFCYGVEPRSKMPVMLFKDLAFLIVFGLIAVFMIKAGDDFTAFAKRAFLFVLIGSAWSGLDWLVRLGRTKGEQTLFSGPWLGIDFLQLILILAMLYLVHDAWWQAFGLAVGFSIALYLDMKIVLAATKPG